MQVPLTHHQILQLAEPFSRRGWQVDLAATQRGERLLRFKPRPVQLQQQALQELLELQCGDADDAQALTLRRTLTHAGGLQAMLVAQGEDPAGLLQQFEALPAAQQFHFEEGFVLACSLRFKGGQPLLTEATLHAGPLRLALRMQVHGFPAEVEIHGAEASLPALPDDLLAVLGRPWTVLSPLASHWRCTLGLRGSAAARSQQAQDALRRAGAHLARTLAQPPQQFHAQHRAARWRVAARRSLPFVLGLGLLGAALLLPRVQVARESVFWMFLFNAPPLLLAGMLCLRELPRFELPRPPRALQVDAWVAASAASPTSQGR